MSEHKVPPSGPNVFKPTPWDKQSFLLWMGSPGKFYKCRAAGPQATRTGPPKEIVPEYIDVLAKSISKRPLMEDPYHLGDD